MKIYIMIMALITIGYIPIYYGATQELRRHIGPGFYIAIASIYLMGFISPTPVIMVVLCMGIMATAPDRVTLACRYMLLAPLVPSIRPELQIAGHTIVNMSLPDALAIGGLIATGRAANRPRLSPPTGFFPSDAYVAIMWFVFSVCADRFTSPTIFLRMMLEQGFSLVLPYVIFRQNIRSKAEFRLVTACLVVVAAMLSVLAFYEAHRGWALFDSMDERFAAGQHIARSSSLRGGALRASVTTQSPLILAFFLMIGLLATVSIPGMFRSRLIRIGTFGVIFLGLVSCQSRGAFLGLAVGFVVLLFAHRRVMASAICVAVAGFSYLVLEWLAHSSARIASFMGVGTQIQGFADYRSLLLARGMQEGMKHPVFGLSQDAIFARLADISQGEHIIDIVNTYLNVFLLSGFVGLGIMVLSIVAMYPPLVRASLRRQDRQSRYGNAFIIAALSGALWLLVTMSYFGHIPVFMDFLMAGTLLMKTGGGRPLRSGVPAWIQRRPAVHDPVAHGAPAPA